MRAFSEIFNSSSCSNSATKMLYTYIQSINIQGLKYMFTIFNPLVQKIFTDQFLFDRFFLLWDLGIDLLNKIPPNFCPLVAYILVGAGRL